MWIIPRPLHTSHFALDTAALTSDCNELSEQCARSLLVRSSPTPARTWLRKWKRDSWTSHLSGRILRPSRGPSFTEKWTSSLGASLVSHLAPQGNEQVTMTPDTCSPTSSEDSESWDDLPLFSSKTWREYSAPSSTAPSGQTHKAHPFCSMSSASWSAWVIKQRQEYSARAKQAHHTSASACSFLVYEMISEQGGAILFQDCSRTQSAQTWPTPTTQETPHPQATLTETGRRASADGTTSHSLNLCDAALLAQNTGARWATPNTMDTLPACTPEALHRHLTQGARAGRTESGNLREQVCVYPWQEPTLGPQDEEPRNTHGSPHESQSGSPTGQLNPRWVEPLMGLPVGWTMVSCAAPWMIEPMNCGSSATESSPQPQSELSESFGSAWGTPRISCANGPGAPEKGDKGSLENQVREHSAPRTK